MSLTNRAVRRSGAGLAYLRPKKVVLFIVTAVLAVLTVFPLLWMLSSSFKSPAEVNSANLIPALPTLANFTYVFTEVPFLTYMFNSFFVAGVVTVGALLFHSMAAYALSWLRFPGRDVLFLGIFSTFLVSLPVILVPLFILVKFLGLLNNFGGLIIPALFNAFGIFLLRQNFKNLWGGTAQTIMIRSQDGTPINVYGGNHVQVLSTNVPKSTWFRIDGKTLWFYRGDFTLVTNNLLPQ